MNPTPPDARYACAGTTARRRRRQTRDIARPAPSRAFQADSRRDRTIDFRIRPVSVLPSSQLRRAKAPRFEPISWSQLKPAPYFDRYRRVLRDVQIRRRIGQRLLITAHVRAVPVEKGPECAAAAAPRVR